MKLKPRSLSEMLTGGDLISPTELSVGLRVSRPTVYSWVRKNYVPYLKLGDLVRFDPTEISIWLKARRLGRGIRCPLSEHGVTIGKDYTEYQECDDCPVRQECATLAAQRQAG